MATVVREDPDSRGGTIGSPESSHRRIYTVHDDGGLPLLHGQVVEAVAGFAPLAIDLFEGGNGAGFFFIPRVKVDAIPARNGGPWVWDGFADYSSFGPDEFGFDIGGNTEHILYNDRGTQTRYPAGAPDMYGFIGVNGENIDGVDLPPGSLANQFTRKVPLPHKLTDTYIGTVKSMRWAVNNAPFYGNAAGECLLLGGSGRNLPDGTSEVSFRWAVAENQTNISIGGGLFTVASKDGWDYLWVYSEDHDDTVANVLVKRPIAAYVERLFPRKDFALLEIGVTTP